MEEGETAVVEDGGMGVGDAWRGRGGKVEGGIAEEVARVRTEDGMTLDV